MPSSESKTAPVAIQRKEGTAESHAGPLGQTAPLRLTKSAPPAASPPGSTLPPLAQSTPPAAHSAKSAGARRGRTIYRGPRLSWRELFFYFLPAILAVLAPLAYGQWRWIYGYTRYGPLAATAWSQPWFRLAAFACLPLLLLALLRRWRARTFIAVSAAGLALHFPPFRRRSLSWGEISGLAAWTVEERLLGLRLSSSQHAVLFPNLGRPIRLSGRIADLPSLVRQVQARLHPRLWPALLAEVQDGRWVHFGPLAVNRQFIQARGRRILLAALAFVGVRAGFLVVESNTGQRLRLPVSRQPNLELFFQLIAQIRSESKEKHAHTS